MITGDQLLCHLIGDYVLQSDYMANDKTKKSVAALAHVVTYTLPFLFITWSPAALAVILVSHFVIDRWRLARYVCWLKNFLAPEKSFGPWVVTRRVGTFEERSRTHTLWWHSWADCSGTGYHKNREPWMTVWLMIIADNTLHILLNGLAIKYLG